MKSNVEAFWFTPENFTFRPCRTDAERKNMNQAFDNFVDDLNNLPCGIREVILASHKTDVPSVK